MVWSWPAIGARDNCLPLFTVVRLLFAAALSAAMGCFFSCFRVSRGRGDSPAADRSRYRTVSQPEVHCNWSQFYSLFISDEKEDQYGVEAMAKEKHDNVISAHELDITELKHQAKFLKACGTLPETPVEVLKLSKECEDSSSQNGALFPSDHNSWLPDMSIVNQTLHSHPEQPLTPSKNCDKLMEGSVSALVTPASCMKDVGNSTGSSSSIHGSPSIEINLDQADIYSDPSVSPVILPSSTRINKSVRFEVDSYPSVSAKAFSSKLARLKPHHSPYPTPLKLTDDMQTPGTIFPSYTKDMPNVKVPRFRCQYVGSTLNLAEKESQLKGLVGEGSTSFQDCNNTSTELPSGMGESDAQPKETNFDSVIGREATTSMEESKLEASQSSWWKPPLNQEDTNLHLGGSVPIRGTPGDRPILGMVAAHWNDDGPPSNISPKWCGANGIPNTTTKYKEDQKVSWHATPFEERLEKALCDETFVLRRWKQISGPPAITFDDNERLISSMT
ncbi:unnamed protein product [Cuscuta campestris]|uniref:Protein JASON n=1 Tax=Cuscuta campestris TaxID=132261 RepID=A0A484L2D1_9ASTE|nr:unnamed protein product [Cuscuta campestris]